MSARTWIGLRIDLPEPFEPFLLGPLSRWLRCQRAERRLARWFFLRHSEDGLHLRLRLRGFNGADTPFLTSSAHALALAPGSEIRVSAYPYDRTALAFGETLESVMAELLHQATSELALRLLASVPNEHWNIVGPSAAFLLAEQSVLRTELVQVVLSWREFAARTAHTWSAPPRSFSAEEIQRCVRNFERLLPRLRTSLLVDSRARRAVGLLRRLRQRGARGKFVAMHGLHLLCNEMGLSIQGESAATQALSELVAASSTPRTAKEGIA